MGKLKVGDRVRVISSTCATHDYLGVVQNHNYDNETSNKYVDVLLDGYEHTITYRESSLKLIDGTTNNKGENLMLGNFKVAGVKFLSGYNTDKVYNFALFDKNVMVGDTVVCDTVNGFTMGDVVKIFDKDELDTSKVSKEIVCKVDMTAFQARKENRDKAAKLKNLMKKRVKELQDTTLFEMMAEKDDSLKTMLDEYKSLMNE